MPSVALLVLLAGLSLVSGDIISRSFWLLIFKNKILNLNFLGHVSTPRCVRTPVKECVPRTVETPRKVKIAKSFSFFPPQLKSDVCSFPSFHYRISKSITFCRSARLLWMCSKTPPSLSVARRSSPQRKYIHFHFLKKSPVESKRGGHHHCVCIIYI